MLRLENPAVRPAPAGIVMVMLMVMTLSGCAVSIKYSYDVQAKFPGLTTYQWRTSGAATGQDSLLETNVQFFVDRDLDSKGLTRKTDQADLIVWMTYEFAFGKTYELSTLSLYVARADNRQVIWRGTASGGIRTDAQSKDLEEMVKGILAAFPPK